MDTFDPIAASKSIRTSFIDYITTRFALADPKYATKLRDELHKPNYITKGPYLELSGSYLTGQSLKELIQSGDASPLFASLEPIPEKERELKIERPLYLHQELALKKARQGKNLVVTTGTGSGKTECFLIPIINQLLREKEAGQLDSGVRAIIIYPMNALANDQMKRMRDLLRYCKDITFGLYNGNTEYDRSSALREYRNTNGADATPLSNELICRDEMQSTPPNILITNYSMLEYMMLRPKDDKVFSGAKLKYIVLDEAHIYKGTTGMETAMLMRRLRARIPSPHNVQYILTSATLGGKDADGDIVAFAHSLCGVDFLTDDIIRSKDATPKMIEENDYSIELFAALANRRTSVSDVLNRFSIPDPAPEGSDEEKLYELLLRTKLFRLLSDRTRRPISIAELRNRLSNYVPITENQLIDFISVCIMAEKGKSSLIKARYHFFVRALEGAYITLNQPIQIFLNRQTSVGDGTSAQEVFEIAVCSDCGRVAIVGKEIDGYLKQVARKSEANPEDCEYYLISDGSADSGLFDEDEDEDDGDQDPSSEENDYKLCPRCGCLIPKADFDHFGPACSCEDAEYVSVVKVNRTKKGHAKCPACNIGEFHAFYLGNEAATSVLGTELFEQLPDKKVNLIATMAANEAVDDSSPFSVFEVDSEPKTVTEARTRQFLCFSDSRSEAAFFANYMEKSYEEFLRRRGIWQVTKQMQEEGKTYLSVAAFVDRLTRLFDANETFKLWEPDERYDTDTIHEKSKRNAWIAILNEMFNARRGTSLPSMGILAFEYKMNNNERFLSRLSEQYQLPTSDVKDLLNQIVMDAVYQGAISPGNSITLTPADREYIFFSSAEKVLIKSKSSGTKSNYALGWAGRMRDNGNYYPSTRIKRLVNAFGISESEADKFLQDYWKGVFRPTGDEYVLDARDFYVRVYGDPDFHAFRCKKCGRITTSNVRGLCSLVKCGGALEEVSPDKIIEGNHYANLYQSTQMKPLQIKEHTAQLAKNHQTLYQQAFVDHKINALSCSTTFEMGVDVGTLETVYMRNVPPSPANYVQRAGRAGRAPHSAAFVLTYAKLSSHDLTFYRDPSTIISGQIKVPIFVLENEKVINRHIYAVALSMFFAIHDEVYAGDNASVLLNENGYELLCDYLNSHPKNLKDMLLKTLPKELHNRFQIASFGWTEGIIGEDGVLSKAVTEFREEVSALEKERDHCKRVNDFEGADQANRALKQLRCGKDDGQRKKSLIDFLARNNVLPKYGFPVDTVELQIHVGSKKSRTDALQLARDLQMAIAEYAPGSEVIADGKVFTSRYIRKEPGKGKGDAWEKGFFCTCDKCGEPNFSTNPLTRKNGATCVSCQSKIPGIRWARTIEPRRGFWADVDKLDEEAPLRKPERDYKTDDYYVGDLHSRRIQKHRFAVDGIEIELESTANDSLAVVGQNEYHVCPACGYASEDVVPMKHKNPRGYFCPNTEGTGTQFTYRLSHTFKTDVAKITFFTPEAQEKNVMLSVLYALLEGLSRGMGIERSDIKGTLHRVSWSGCERPIFSLVLYDAVAGGAGHVRRVVTEDGAAFKAVVTEALHVVENCNCDPSCYQCLRNYYNQKIHDILDRHLAANFLKAWQGDYLPVEASDDEDEDSLELVSGDKISTDYKSWAEVSEAYDLGEQIAQWDVHSISLDCFLFPSFSGAFSDLSPWFLWENEKVLVFEDLNGVNSELLTDQGWKVLDASVAPEDLAKLVGGT